MEGIIDIPIKDSMMKLFTCRSLLLYEWASIFNFFTFLFLGLHTLCSAVYYKQSEMDSYGHILLYVSAAFILFGTVATFVEKHLRQWGLYIGCFLYALQIILLMCEHAILEYDALPISSLTFLILALLIISNIDFIYGGPYVHCCSCLTIKDEFVVTLSILWLCISLYMILWGATFEPLFDSEADKSAALHYAGGSCILFGMICMLLSLSNSFDLTCTVSCHMIFTGIGVFLFLVGWSFNIDAYYQSKHIYESLDAHIAELCFLTLMLFSMIGFDFYFLGMHQMQIDFEKDPELQICEDGSKIPTNTLNTTPSAPPSHE